MENDIDLYDMVLNSLTESYQNHPFFAQLKQQIYETKYILPPGSTAPQLMLPDTNNITVNLYAQNANLILIDFWASWCGPCRHENRVTVKPLYEKYKEKGFLVFSVSMDDKRANWIKAIKEDIMNWVNVSDLQGNKSEVYNIYKIDGLPTTYLVDKKTNTIVSKNLRGEELKNFIENYYK